MASRSLTILRGELVTGDASDESWWYQAANENGNFDAIGPFNTIKDALAEGRLDLESECSLNWPRSSYELSIDE